METGKAWLVDEFGAPDDVLRLGRTSHDSPGPDQIMIRVRAVGIGVADDLVCRGRYQERPGFPFSPGLEVSGDVLHAPPDSEWSQGDPVMALPELPDGGLREVLTVSARRVLPVPPGMTYAQAAAFPISYHTAFYTLRMRGAISAGDAGLVLGAAGALGLAALDLSAAWGTETVAAIRGDERAGACVAAGARHVVDLTREGALQTVLDLTGGRGFDWVFDPVSGPLSAFALDCLADEGRLFVLGFAGGSAPSVELTRILLSNVTIVGIHYGGHIALRPTVVTGCHEGLLAHHAMNAISPTVDRLVPFVDAPEAFEALGDRGRVGRVVVVADAHGSGRVPTPMMSEPSNCSGEGT